MAASQRLSISKENDEVGHWHTKFERHRDINIGNFYDLRRQIFQDKCVDLEEKNDDKSSTECNVYKVDGRAERSFRIYGIGNPSIETDMGAINTSKEPLAPRGGYSFVVLKLETTKSTQYVEEIDIANEKTWTQEDETHMVYKVRFGCRAVFIFKRGEAHNKSDVLDIFKCLREMKDRGKIGSTFETKLSSLNGFRCRFYGDFPLESTSETFNIEMLSKQWENIKKAMEDSTPKPVEITLYPLNAKMHAKLTMNLVLGNTPLDENERISNALDWFHVIKHEVGMHTGNFISYTQSYVDQYEKQIDETLRDLKSSSLIVESLTPESSSSEIPPSVKCHSTKLDILTRECCYTLSEIHEEIVQWKTKQNNTTKRIKSLVEQSIQRIKAASKTNSTVCHTDDLWIFQPFLREEVSSQKWIKRYSLGRPNLERDDHKTLLLVGASGSGKTTLINAMVNCIMGVHYKDDFRFELIPVATSQVTTRVSLYTLHPFEGNTIPFTLTIIDTPGFASTGVTEDEKAVLNVMKRLLREQIVDHIDLVGCVIQSFVTRLTAAQKKMFSDFSYVLGEGVPIPRVVLLTFADAQDSQVLRAISDSNLGHEGHYSFNNSALYSSIDECKETRAFKVSLWTMCQQNFSSLWSRIQNVEHK